jgi:hypothetical protein
MNRGLLTILMRNALAHAGKNPGMYGLRRHRRRAVADPMRAKFLRFSTLKGEAEHDVSAFMTFARGALASDFSINPLEPLSAEIKRRTAAVRPVPT